MSSVGRIVCSGVFPLMRGRKPRRRALAFIGSRAIADGANRSRKSAPVALGQVLRQEGHEACFEVRPGAAFVSSQEVGIPGTRGSASSVACSMNVDTSSRNAFWLNSQPCSSTTAKLGHSDKKANRRRTATSRMAMLRSALFMVPSTCRLFGSRRFRKNGFPKS